MLHAPCSMVGVKLPEYTVPKRTVKLLPHLSSPSSFIEYTYRAEDLLSLCLLLIQSPGTALSDDGIRDGLAEQSLRGCGVEEVSFLVESDIPLSTCLPLVSVLESII